MKKLSTQPNAQIINDVLNYLESQSQFHYTFTEEVLELTQKEDSKQIVIDFAQVEKVLDRQDVDGSRFLQVNFKQGTKILVTKALIGFKPLDLVGFDLARIPRVVTTIDLVSVAKAIEDLFDTEENADSKSEVEVLKKVYQSILFGAVNIGFKMQAEKKWLTSILLNHSAAVA
ncbi:MAG: hypothetical protein H7061_03140 [Bdellovibrionaceae bacterium]|nr:hypothetical protein [Bdellovibrio sp.]